MPSINFGYWMVQTVAMLLTCFLIPRLRVGSPFSALLVVVAIGFVNAHFWDNALFSHVPAELTTQTVLLFFANGIMFWVLVKLLPGIEVDGFLPALVAPVVFTIASLVVSELAERVDWAKVGSEAIRLGGEAREYFQKSELPKP